MNAMLVSPVGELFLGAIETTGKEKDTVYMATVIEKFIEQIGKENILQVCTDNAPVMLSAGKLIISLSTHFLPRMSCTCYGHVAGGLG